MDVTEYHAKYFAHELSRIKEYNSDEKISNALFNAKVDLNPHQVEAALFAFKSPLSKGVILADEVGLGKTIEAGLVISQYWAENKRKIIIICPSSLRHQWSNELEEKFNIHSIIMESKSFNIEYKDGNENPFIQKNKAIILSYNFASNKKDILRLLEWDLVVIDEAHKLRNCYKPNNKIGNNIKWAFPNSKKLLLTATPLQNSLLELYGLVSLIDSDFFGELNVFKDIYIRDNNIDELRDRLKLCIKRNLRKDVLEYIKYTKRYPITIEFSATDPEMKLYNEISEFLTREESYAIPKSQRALTTLIIRKLLASSTQAILQTLITMKNRLEELKLNHINYEKNMDIQNFVDEDLYFQLEQDIDDMNIDEEHEEECEEKNKKEIDLKLLNEEIASLEKFIAQAKSIEVDSKSKSLLKALDIGFEKTKQLGGNRKVLIFTENKRTQKYIAEFLTENGYKDKLVLFNGSNSSQQAKEIYSTWMSKDVNKNKINGSKTANIRQALIEYFRDECEIMIATEAAAEGVNMQFCSFVINYDLPWNPQRIEQRIGRCHRYGQKNDVVVINFVNRRNHADMRVYELLKDKLNLFEGVFGSSDKVLGNIESGLDFEKRILNIYQKCRSPKEIDNAFDILQKSMEDSINSKMTQVEQELFENFDLDVREKLKTNLSKTKQYLNKYENMFWNISKYILRNYSVIDDNNYIIDLKTQLMKGAGIGKYKLISKNINENTIEEKDKFKILAMNEPIGEFVMQRALISKTDEAFLKFNITNNKNKISIINEIKGKKGYLILKKLHVKSFAEEDHLIFNGIAEDGEILTEEQCEKMFYCMASVENRNIPQNYKNILQRDSQIHIQSKLNEISRINQEYFKQEQERLMKWEDDMLYSIEDELTHIKAQIRRKEREKLAAISEQEMLSLDEEISQLIKKRRHLRNYIDDMEDKIKEKRKILTDKLRKDMESKSNIETLFIIGWEVV